MLEHSNCNLYLLRIYNRLKFYYFNHLFTQYIFASYLLHVSPSIGAIRDRKRIILIYWPSNVTNMLDHFIYSSSQSADYQVIMCPRRSLKVSEQPSNLCLSTLKALTLAPWVPAPPLRGETNKKDTVTVLKELGHKDTE